MLVVVLPEPPQYVIVGRWESTGLQFGCLTPGKRRPGALPRSGGERPGKKLNARAGFADGRCYQQGADVYRQPAFLKALAASRVRGPFPRFNLATGELMQPSGNAGRIGPLADEDLLLVEDHRNGDCLLFHSGFGTRSSSRPGEPMML